MSKEIAEAYPLCWPTGWKKISDNIYRDRARFETSLTKARDELLHELSLMRAEKVILSTNIPLRRDGLPYAGMSQPKDPGAAVYFMKGPYGKKKQYVLACDRWQKVEDNIQAIRLSVAAIRGLERWGASEVLERAFTGFAALPAPEAITKEWWDVLQVRRDSPLSAAESNYRSLARSAHPDNGGSHERMSELNNAIAQARKVLRN